MKSFIILACVATQVYALTPSDFQNSAIFQKLADTEKTEFIGILKVRNRSAEQKAYYLELKDGSKIHISTSVDAEALKKLVHQDVKVLARLREKTTHKNDFIRQIYSIEAQKTAI
ncbi:hypothetical protein PQO03_05580 [Lentisphaera profundi]|uniref:Uncharacterized protein n=1 Tax=Lentisphaera profundi TaxID=1658616 RepID=A0ABY7VW34_9BACT|nr:hypothetical protein [Lentisphaera profundi]WDE97420.1 hypothetical protein PQO03_05580 [Lentisphaera profundi]